MGTAHDTPRRRRPWVFVGSATTIVLAIVLAVTFASRFGVDPDYVASAVIDRPVPSLELPRLGAEGTVALDDLPGEIVVVNFWASWCQACRNEHDDLLAAADRYRAFGVHFVGVVYQDSESAAIAFLDELGWGYEYVTDPGSRAAIDFGLRGVPETYFVSRDGIITARISGESTLASLSAFLDQMLLQPAAEQAGGEDAPDTGPDESRPFPGGNT